MRGGSRANRMVLHSRGSPGGFAVPLKYMATALLPWLFAITPSSFFSDRSIRLSPILLLHPCLFHAGAEKIMKGIIPSFGKRPL